MKKLLITVILLLVVLVLSGALLVYFRPIAVISAVRRHDLVKAGFVKETVDSPVGAQRIFAAGNGPTLILIHGAGDDAGTWKEVAPKLTSKYHVVLVDIAGHGESAPASGPLKMQTMLDGLDAVVQRQTTPAVLVGNSLGAWLAMFYANEHPERVARVVAVDGGPLRGDRVDLAQLPESREDARKIWDAILDPGSPRIPNFILDDVVRQSHRGAIGRMDRADLEAHLMTEDSLHTFPVQVDVLWGKEDRLVPVDYANRMVDALRLPQLRMVFLGRCGHIPQQECPIRFTEELQNALNEPIRPRSPAPLRTKEAALQVQK